MDTQKKIERLEEFKRMVLEWRSSEAPDIRSKINQEKHWVRQEVREAHCLNTITIGPPPAFGGLVMKDVDLFEHMFDPPYGKDLLTGVVDMVDSTIGVLRRGSPHTTEAGSIPITHYYHVIIETNEKVDKSGKNKQYFEFDKVDIDEVKTDIIRPYLLEQGFQFDGYFLKPAQIIRIAVKQSDKAVDQLVKIAYEDASGSIAIITRERIVNGDEYTKDITKILFSEVRNTIELKKTTSSALSFDKSKVFIVHGHDDLAKIETARLMTDLGFEPVILHEQPNSGKATIEKIEQNTDVGFAIVLYTPCDKGGKDTEPIELKPRARQNVIFEHGYLIGKLGRQNVCALVKGDIETPSDIRGMVYTSLDEHGAWKYKLANEMKSAGYKVDLNKIK